MSIILAQQPRDYLSQPLVSVKFGELNQTPAFRLGLWQQHPLAIDGGNHKYSKEENMPDFYLQIWSQKDMSSKSTLKCLEQLYS